MKYLIVDIANQLAINSHVRVPEMELIPVAAITLTLNNIVKLYNQYKCDHIVIACEGGSWRKDYYTEYKANRTVKKLLLTESEKEKQKYFFEETDKFISFLKEKTNCSVLKAPKIEGDDFIARWTQLHPEDEHIILSSDGDFIQLLQQENVSIYNSGGKYLLNKNYALNDDNNIAYIEKIVTEQKDGVDIKMKKSFPVNIPNPEYELFKKCIRGDAGDNIMSAYPKCFEKSTKNKVGIIDAFSDRINKSIYWNMFMLHEWEKIIGKDEDGKPIIKKVRVIDEYETNKILIDLTQQPEDIKDLMDEVINEEKNKTRKFNVGFDFIRICNDLNLGTVKENIGTYATPFNHGVKKNGSKNNLTN